MQLLPKATTDEQVLVLTENAGEYWHGKSKNNSLQEKLYAELIPAKDEADNVHGMLLRAVTKIYYDIYNNGGGNMIDNIHGDWLEEGDEGYEEPEYELVGLYKGFFENLKRFMPADHQECVSKAKSLVLAGDIDTDIIFDHLVDRVIHTILTTRNIVHE